MSGICHILYHEVGGGTRFYIFYMICFIIPLVFLSAFIKVRYFLLIFVLVIMFVMYS